MRAYASPIQHVVDAPSRRKRHVDHEPYETEIELDVTVGSGVPVNGDDVQLLEIVGLSPAPVRQRHAPTRGARTGLRADGAASDRATNKLGGYALVPDTGAGVTGGLRSMIS